MTRSRDEVDERALAIFRHAQAIAGTMRTLRAQALALHAALVDPGEALLWQASTLLKASGEALAAAIDAYLSEVDRDAPDLESLEAASEAMLVAFTDYRSTRRTVSSPPAGGAPS